MPTRAPIIAIVAGLLCSCGTGAKLVPDQAPTAEEKMGESADSLGDDALLIPIPSDDDTLIGKVHIPRQQGGATEASFQANPCREHLAVKSFDAHRKVRDIRRFAADINSSAVIQVLKVGASVGRATDYQYDFEVSRKVVADDTVEYANCCSKLRGGCGNHFVFELYYGEGKYRLLEKTEGEAKAGLPMIFDAAASASYAVLAEQSFRGFFAYKTKETPAPAPEASTSRVVAVPTDSGPDLVAPATPEGAALLEQDGARILLTTKSAPGARGDRLKAIGSARQKQRRALKNLLAGPPYNTPPATLNQRVEQVYGSGQEVDAYEDDAGDWLLKVGYVIQ